MALFGFLKSSGSADLSRLVTDVHSHLLPGLDDGSKSPDHSIGMIRKFEELGYKKLITTPHVMHGVYDNNAPKILQKLEEVRQAISAAGLKITLEASAEYFLDEHFLELIRRGDLLPFSGNHILFECAFNHEPKFLDEAVFMLRSQGYRPVLAHFERYNYFHGSLDAARRVRDAGCYIQLNLNSLTGHYGPEIQKQGLRMIRERIVDIASSDCHRIEHLQLLEKHLSDKPFHRLLELDLKNPSL
jgi:protein-tyrosine phosphatase